MLIKTYNKDIDVKHILNFFRGDFNKPFNLIFNSGGGSIEAGLLFIYLLKQTNVNNILVVKDCHSMAFPVFMSFDINKRFCFYKAEFYFHGTYVSGIDYSHKDKKKLQNLLKTGDREYSKALNHLTIRQKRQVDKWSLAEKTCDVNDLVRFGFLKEENVFGV